MKTALKCVILADEGIAVVEALVEILILLNPQDLTKQYQKILHPQHTQTLNTASKAGIDLY